MSDTIPTIGRIVNYVLTDGDVTAINQRRTDARDSLEMHRKYKTGAIIHAGNAAHEGDVYPMMITRVWGNATPGQPDSATPVTQVNGQVFLDGNDTIWVTSVKFDEAGTPRTFTY